MQKLGHGEQARFLAKVVFWGYVPAIVLWFAVLLFSRHRGMLFEYFVRDIFYVLKAPVYAGFFSNLGVFMFGSSAALCFATAHLLGRAGSRETGACLLHAGFLSLVLMLDDFFMLHEHVVPNVMHVSQYVLQAAEMLYTLFWFLRYRQTIAVTHDGVLFCAFGLFAISFGVDALEMSVSFHHTLEDGSKFLGILTWLIYFTQFCLAELSSRLALSSEAKSAIKSSLDV